MMFRHILLATALTIMIGNMSFAALSSDPDGIHGVLNFGDGPTNHFDTPHTVGVGPGVEFHFANSLAIVDVDVSDDEVLITYEPIGTFTPAKAEIFLSDLEWGVPGSITGVTELSDTFPAANSDFPALKMTVETFGPDSIKFTWDTLITSTLTPTAPFSAHYRIETTHPDLVPEPSTYITWGIMGLVGTCLYIKRCKKNKK